MRSRMKLNQPVLGLLIVVLLFLRNSLTLGFSTGEDVFPKYQRQFSSGGVTDQVQWDQYSLILKGQRIFLHSGEFHTFRLPVPSLWLDILQKIKAAGLNGISVYLHWGAINPSRGVIDFDGIRSLQTLFDLAKSVGLWVVLRPGPYMNAETTAGGIPHWVTAEVAGTLRTNATDYHETWEEYIGALIKFILPNQINEGGPLIAVQIDNEYSQGGFGRAEYFQELEDVYRAGGVVVPLTYNDPGQHKNFVNGTGAVDIYGLDQYPQGFDCSNPLRWSSVVGNNHDYHLDTNPSQPFYIPEFQGGAFDPWGPTAPGYPNCQILTGPDFEDVFYKALWADNVKLLNFYMLYGGTSWGSIPFPGVYTSYDYGSSIQENRLLTPKYTELKQQGIFLRSSPDFYKTAWVGNSSSSAVNVSNPDIFAVFLSNPDTGSGFYITRHSDSTSTETTEFTLDVSTSLGSLTVPKTIPSITLSGRQSKLVVTDYTFGVSSKLLYSTATVFFAGQIGSRDVLFLSGDSDQQHEFAVFLNNGSSVVSDTRLQASQSASLGGVTTVAVLGNLTGLLTVFESDSQLVLFGDSDTAGTFFSPVIPASGKGDFSHYWQFGSNASVLIGGPYLVRNATISEDGSALSLWGDLSEDVELTVFAPDKVKAVEWNGRVVGSLESRSGKLVGKLELEGKEGDVVLPALSDWRFANSLPEIQDGFDDRSWTIANKTSTNSPFKPFYGDGRVLYGCDYQFCENIVLWRGHFNGTSSEKSVNLSINGGEAFAASVWLNDVFLNTSFGNSTNNRHILEETDDKFDFPEGSVRIGRDNVITVVQDNMGLNETQSDPDTSKSPRGIRGFKLNDGSFGEWKVQGKVGGYTKFLDRTRGIVNEGGLFGEREGWHLPGFDTSSWTKRNLSDGLPNGTAGVGFFVTKFNLDVPKGRDVPLSFVFDGDQTGVGDPYRAILFVNGWMMGKRVGNLGPQTKFPVHEGILDYHGENTVAVALWSLLPDGPGVSVKPTLDLVLDGYIEGGVGGIEVNNPGYLDRV